jgi:hypothetical protein
MESRSKTTGLISIELPDISLVNCQFINGVLKEGFMQIADIKYCGTYDENGLLHGFGSMSIGDVVYQGNYNHGMLTSGRTFVNNVCTEEGIYAFTSRQKRPALLEGTKHDETHVSTGKFDAMGHLLNGTMQYDHIIYSGQFDNDKLVNGRLICWIGEEERIFEASYKLTRNVDLHVDVFETCDVKWDGLIEGLPTSYLVMLCCSAKNSRLAHVFYIKYLHDFDSSSIRYLNRCMFGKLKPEDEAGLQIILANLRKHADFVTADIEMCEMSCRLRRSKSM